MKKLILAVAITCAAAMVQAASVGWTCLAIDAAYREGGYSVFVVGQNGVTSVDQIKALVAAGGLSSADDYAFYNGGSVTAAGAASLNAAASGKAITYKDGGTTEENTWQAFIFVQSKDGDKASYTATTSVTLANNSTGKTFAFASQAAATAANGFTINTPEPTSGVLLLLGIAGLALKRKRA